MDGVAQSVLRALILTAAGAYVSFRVGRPPEGCSGECGDNFDSESAEKIDLIFAVVVFVYIVGWSYSYHVIYMSKMMETNTDGRGLGGRGGPWGTSG